MGVLFVLWQAFIVLPRLAQTYTQSSCICLLSAEIAGVSHHAWIIDVIFLLYMCVGHHHFYLTNKELLLFLLWDKVFLCNPGYPGTPSVNQADLKLRICLSLPLSARIKGVYHHHLVNKEYLMQTNVSL